MNASEATTVAVRRDIPFHVVDGEALLLDVYEDTGTTGPKPAAVLVRGGGFTVGDKGEFARHAIDLAAEGYLVVEPQYRLAPEHTFPAALVDVKAAIEWCRTEAEQVDPERVAAVGHSAGANLAVLAAATADAPALEPEQYPGVSSALSVAVGYSGIYDFGMGLDDRRVAYLGGSPDDLPAAYDLASPVEQADTSMPPTLLLHGEDDGVVDPQQSAVLAETLEPLTTVDHRTVAGGHGFPFEGGHYAETYERTTDFLARQLSGPGRDMPDRTDDY
ncbi:alpha/beta hydrolase [Haloarcula onubensis]|uniref:Alpha/beta hydrolase n=1 Tax=Haloarcula onubensis TaxID=2950539 RepID=A0ABU2FQV9_9EURY|nr:alpha/beta hydrolase [Halomicroarcula sp. S3CR25-11]MDS0283145.1 alpha/beta hydrolase [Halomicroarcula sp. S3CR25-11]